MRQAPISLISFAEYDLVCVEKQRDFDAEILFFGLKSKDINISTFLKNVFGEVIIIYRICDSRIEIPSFFSTIWTLFGENVLI